VLPACSRVELSQLVTPAVVQKHIEIAQEIWPYISRRSRRRASRNRILVVLDRKHALVAGGGAGSTGHQSDPQSWSSCCAPSITPPIGFISPSNRFPGRSDGHTRFRPSSNSRSRFLGVIPEIAGGTREPILQGRAFFTENRTRIWGMRLQALGGAVLNRLDRARSETAHNGISSQFLRHKTGAELKATVGAASERRAHPAQNRRSPPAGARGWRTRT